MNIFLFNHSLNFLTLTKANDTSFVVGKLSSRVGDFNLSISANEKHV